MKKITLYAAGITLGLVALNAMAAIPTKYYRSTYPLTPCPDYRPVRGLYVDGDIGLSNQNWRYSGLINNANDASVSFNHSLTNNPNGFTGGFDLGYKFNQNIAAEVGAYFLPTVDAHWTFTEGGTSSTGTANIFSWFSYTALKLMAPVYYNTDVFVKIGGAARSAEFRNDASGIGKPGEPNMDANSFNFLFGAGAQYYYNNIISFNAEWIHLNGASVLVPASATPPAALPASISVPPLNAFLVGIGINLSNYC